MSAERNLAPSFPIMTESGHYKVRKTTVEGKWYVVEQVELVTAVAAAVGTVGLGLRLRAWERVMQRQVKEAARGERVRNLPQGSRIVEFGDHGMVIDVGGGEDRCDAGR